MKKISLLLSLLGICLTVQSQVPDSVNSSNKDVVINQKMIDNFNSIEYQANQVNFTYILANYSFYDAKDVIIAYRSGKIETTTIYSVDQFLAENKKETIEPENPVSNETENQLLAKH